MKYDAEVNAAVAHWGRSYGITIDPALVHAVIEKESSHGRDLVTKEPPDKAGNPRWSYGPMMVLDSTAKGLGVADPKVLVNPWLGIHYGVKYLAQQLRNFPGDIARAVSAYNTGPGRAVRTDGRFPNQPYVTKVLAFWQRFKTGAIAAAPAAGAIALMGMVLLFLVTRRRRAAA